ncbi:MAG: aldehyde dehydrogenase [bacterium]|nr:aldehyde dehydrogenase [bacterium]
METERIERMMRGQRLFFDEGNTKPFDFRIIQLKKLKESVKRHETEILAALRADFHKPNLEAFVTEIGVVYEEINYAIKHLADWMTPQQADTPLALQPSSSKIVSEPLGLVLIIAPWNYPFQLLISPLIGAISAGNCCLLKPSAKTAQTALVIGKIMGETFEENYIAVVQGPGSMVGPLLIEKYRFDHIFFSGSTDVGKQIMKMAAEHLTPVTLELGGKSPAIVDKGSDLDLAAKRLVWAKFLNAGQTCVSPDYLLAHASVKEELVKKMVYYIGKFYGEEPIKSKDFTHIVNEKRFSILTNYLKNVHILHGGKFERETLCIEPTLVDGVSEDHALLQEEIFGPIFPVFTFNELEEVLSFIRKRRYPLALYAFTSNKKTEDFLIDQVEFGGGCINNALVHLANSNLPFGGVGQSGMGNYHGKHSFDTFSHKKSIVKSKTYFDLAIKYPPFSAKKEKWLRYFFR